MPRLPNAARRPFSTVRPPLLASLQSQHIAVISSPRAGRSLVAAAPFFTGDVVLTEAAPLAIAGDPARVLSSCAHCLRELEPAAAVTLCAACGARYCSAPCRDAATAHSGHELLCGGEAALNAWCAEAGHNFPRVAANALARSFTGGRNFEEYWATFNSLVYATPPETDALPRAHVEGYAHVRGAFLKAGKLSGAGVTTFFDTVFNLRAYARLMGTLRLNAFSVVVNPNAPAQPADARAPTADAQTSVGCCDSSASEDCAPSGSCAESPSALGDAPGGTAVYEAASLANHECEPSCDVVIAAGGALALRARRNIADGDALTITYLDSSLPVDLRRKKLLLGYGFDCECAMCREQQRALLKTRAQA
jgi:hypothetical protein